MQPKSLGTQKLRVYLTTHSAAALSRDLGVTAAAVSRWKTGRQPKRQAWAAIERATGIHPFEWLMQPIEVAA